METLRRSAQAAVEDSEKIFTELIQSMERRRSEVKELIRAQEKAELSLAEELLKKLEQEIADLRRRDAELEKLLHSEDPVRFLQSLKCLPELPVAESLSSINRRPQFSIEFLKKIVFDMEQLNRFSKLEVVKIYEVHTLLPTEPKSREKFLKSGTKRTWPVPETDFPAHVPVTGSSALVPEVGTTACGFPSVRRDSMVGPSDPTSSDLAQGTRPQRERRPPIWTCDFAFE